VTLQNSVITVVSTPQNASLAFGPGVWQFEQLTTVRGSTNEPVTVSGARDGAVILVDATGYVEVYNGPRLDEAAINGLSLAFLTVGVLLFCRWVVRSWGRGLVGGAVE